MKSVRGKIAGAAVLLMSLGVLEQVTGLVRQIVLAGFFGTSEVLDSYLVAMAVVMLFRVWITLPINQTLIPIFRYDIAKQGEKTAWANVSTLLNNLVMVLLVITLLGMWLAPYLVNVVAPGLDEESLSLSSSLTRICIFTIFFVGLGNVLAQILYSYERFFLAGVGGTVENVIAVTVLWLLYQNYGVHGLAVATLMGVVFQFASRLPILWEKRDQYLTRVDLKHSGMLEMGKLSFPLLISSGGEQVARVTDRIFASLLPAGRLSALAFAHRLLSAGNNFFIDSFQQATFPHFTMLSAEEKFKTLSRQLSQYVRLVFFLTLPMAIGLMVLSETIVRLAYQRGAFDETSVQLTSQALFYYAMGFPAIALGRILNRTFFSLKNTKTPSKVAVIRITVKITLAWLLIKPLSHSGIALAESVSQALKVVLLFVLLPNEVKGEEAWSTIRSFGQTLAGSVLMGIAVYLLRVNMNGWFGVPLEIATLAFAGVAIYGITAFLAQGEDFQSALKVITALGERFLPKRS